MYITVFQKNPSSYDTQYNGQCMCSAVYLEPDLFVSNYYGEIVNTNDDERMMSFLSKIYGLRVSFYVIEPFRMKQQTSETV
ncbi:hypothetical protein CEXT_92801 [Caerostris extrusa]|uniref:Uncharacterized protein n=1 Tax=Caerostris extrusa TaxID=172846 RepID=A0AAV4NZT1_CAEEX|nr:hypothetical protein CEXT_92801 [Caerostris extrusa]